ncbi:MAG: DNA primase [Bernardetiaceae bacterium]
MIPPETIQRIRDTADIVEVVGDFVTLKRSGSSYKAHSPFTDEKTPSFYVVPSKNIFKCFSSGKGGDAITFIMEHEGMSYVEAVRYLAKKYNIEIAETHQTDKAQAQAEQQRRQALLIVLDYAQKHFQALLTQHPDGKAIGWSYLKERGFRDQTIATFGLGYSLDDWHHLEHTAQKKGYTLERLVEAGLVVRKDDGKTYDRFRGRVMFPIRNLSGAVVAFGARTLKKDDKPKYLNSPESEVYIKSNVLYGLFEAKKAIRQKDSCILVEGYTDVTSLHQAGIQNVVASSGTALTPGQIRQIKRFTQNLILLYDGDPAGIRASLRGIDLVLAQDMNVSAVVLPDGDDPDSFVGRHGGEAFEAFLEIHKRDFIRFRIELSLQATTDDPIERAKVMREVAQSVAQVPDAFKRSVFARQSSTLLQIDEQVFISEVNKYILQQQRQQQQQQEQQPSAQEPEPKPAPSEPAPSSSLAMQERELLRLLIKHGHELLTDGLRVCDYLFEETEEIQLSHPICQSLWERYRIVAQSQPTFDEQAIWQQATTEESRFLSDLLVVKNEISQNWERRFAIRIADEKQELPQMLYRNLMRLKLRTLRDMMQQNLRELRQTTDEQTLNDLQLLHIELKKQEMEIAKILGNVVMG